jgi:hypothetical protein
MRTGRRKYCDAGTLVGPPRFSNGPARGTGAEKPQLHRRICREHRSAVRFFRRSAVRAVADPDCLSSRFSVTLRQSADLARPVREILE